jgi:hypothetical protein
VAWARTGAKNGQVDEHLRRASVNYRSLRFHFGREGLRRKQGGALSEPEQRQLARLQASERRFAESLRRLRAEARRRRDAATAAELERFRAEAERVAQASANLSTYLNALIAASELRGEWQANVPYIRKTAPPVELAAADDTVEDLYVDADIGHVFTADLGKTEEPPSPAKVQVFQPGEEREAAVVVEPILDDEEEGPAGDDTTVSEPAPEVPEAGGAEAPAPEAPKPAAQGGEPADAATAPAAAPIPPPIG